MDELDRPIPRRNIEVRLRVPRGGPSTLHCPWCDAWHPVDTHNRFACVAFLLTTAGSDT